LKNSTKRSQSSIFATQAYASTAVIIIDAVKQLLAKYTLRQCNH